MQINWSSWGESGRTTSNLLGHDTHEFATLSTGAPGAGREDPQLARSLHRERQVSHTFDGKGSRFQSFTLHLRDDKGRTPRMHRCHFYFLIDTVDGVRGHC